MPRKAEIDQTKIDKPINNKPLSSRFIVISDSNFRLNLL